MRATCKAKSLSFTAEDSTPLIQLWLSTIPEEAAEIYFKSPLIGHSCQEISVLLAPNLLSYFRKEKTSEEFNVNYIK